MLEWGEEVLNQIEEVSMDMTGNYKSLVKKLCPHADVTVDRFHVTKMIHEELNQARIEQNKSASSLKAKERAKFLESLKGSKYTLLKAENDLSSQQKINLKQVKYASPLVGNMHSLKTIKRWLGEIGGYFEQRTTNGIVEGINTKLKLLKRCGFGFRNLINFEIRALLFWHFPKKLAQ
jgi:transposase